MEISLNSSWENLEYEDEAAIALASSHYLYNNATFCTKVTLRVFSLWSSSLRATFLFGISSHLFSCCLLSYSSSSFRLTIFAFCLSNSWFKVLTASKLAPVKSPKRDATSVAYSYRSLDCRVHTTSFAIDMSISP